MTKGSDAPNGAAGISKPSAGIAAAVTVIGGTLVIGGQPVAAATFEVTNTSATGDGSLAQAIDDANGAPGPDTITFAPTVSGTIDLGAATLVVRDDVDIIGPGSAVLTITNTAGDLIYLYDSVISATISGLALNDAAGDAVSSNDVANVSLSDLEIAAPANSGISLSGDDDTIVSIENVTVTDSGSDGISLYSVGTADLDQVAVGNASNDGIYIGDVRDVTITSSSVSGSGDDGIEISSVTVSATISDVEVSASYATGLYVGGDSTNTEPGTYVDLAVVSIDQVTVTDSYADDGIYVSDVADVTILNSTVSGSDDDGIAIDGVSGHVTLTEVGVSNSGDVGFLSGDIQDLTLSNSTVSESGGRGIEVYPIYGDATITDVDVTGSGDDGIYIDTDVASGAASVVAPAGDLTVTIERVTVTDSIDNGLYLRGEDAAHGFVVRDVSVSGSGESGIRLADDPGNTTFDSVTITDSDEHGFLVDDAPVDSTVSFSAVTVENSGMHGLSFSGVEGDVSITDSSITASGLDGVDVSGFAPGPFPLADAQAVMMPVVKRVDVERVTIADSGDRAMSIGSSSVAASIVNSTLTGNGDETTDSVIHATNETLLDVAHSTISGNGVDASTAPVIDGPDADVTVDHTVLSGNNGAPVASPSASGSLSVTNSLTPVGSDLGASNVESDDPLLGALADNGGATQTLSPLAGSPVIDAGDAAIVDAPATDQRGADRQVRTIDIGSVEVADPTAVVSLAPERYVDTRASGATFDDRFEAEGKRVAGSEYRVQIAGRGGVPLGAQAAVLNVTAVAPDGKGYLTVHPCVTPRPNASSSNYTAGVNVANEIVAPLSASGEVCIYTSEGAHIVVDVVGFVDADSPTMAMTPARFLDTRATGLTFDGANQAGGRTTAGGQVTLQVAGRGGVPADAVAVIANVAAVNPSGTGFVTVHPCEPAPPNASSLNYVDGVNRANELIASVNADGEICVLTSTSTDLIVDVVGYIPAGTSFTSVGPARYLDTRVEGKTVDGMAQRGGKRTGGSQLELQVAGRPGVPEGVSAVVVNVTAAAPEATGFVTVHPCEPVLPNVSSLNYVAGVNGANELIARVDARGRICLFTDQNTHLIVDVVGYLE